MLELPLVRKLELLCAAGLRFDSSVGVSMLELPLVRKLELLCATGLPLDCSEGVSMFELPLVRKLELVCATGLRFDSRVGNVGAGCFLEGTDGTVGIDNDNSADTSFSL